MNAKVGSVVLLILGSLAAVLFITSCRQRGRDTLEGFGVSLFNAAASNDVDVLLADYTVTKDEAVTYLNELKKQNPGTIIYPENDQTEASLARRAKEEINLYLSSYRKVLSGEPVKCAEAAGDAFGSTQLIVWARMPDGKFRGILIPSVIKTANGYKVCEWLRRTSADTQRVRLESDTLDGCTFPRALPIYDSSRD